MTEPALVELNDVSFGYDNRTVLERVNLAIYATDYMVVIGPNGGGKTTMAKLILGLLAPRLGKVILRLEKGRRGIGYVPQFSTFDWQFPLQVSEIIRMGRCYRRGLLRWFNSADDRAVRDIAEEIRITHLLNAFVSELSGGELQRVLIARALISEPELLILDEPTAAIDSDSRNTLNSILNRFNQSIPIVLITHDATAITPATKRIVCVNRQVYVHDSGEVSEATLNQVYGCPVELIAHGVPHRVLKRHRD
ncbi:MAG: metal ABC transporter ATP-binding protein [Candidatus Neomarinimicrobiota bacterium]